MVKQHQKQLLLLDGKINLMFIELVWTVEEIRKSFFLQLLSIVLELLKGVST